MPKLTFLLLISSLPLVISCGLIGKKTQTKESVRQEDPYKITDEESYRKNFIIPKDELEFGTFSLTAGELITPEDVESDLAEFKDEIFASGNDTDPLGFSLVQAADYDRYGEYLPVNAAELLDDEMGVTKYSPEELAEKEIYFTPSGRTYQKSGVAMKPTKQGEEQIYVMDKRGRMYVTDSVMGKHHHTSFFGGGPIAAGGTIDFDNEGRLKEIDNSTGHYQVPHHTLNNVMSELSRRRVSVKKLKVGMIKTDRKTGDLVKREKLFDVMEQNFPEEREYFKNKPKNEELDRKLEKIQSLQRKKKLEIQQDNDAFNRNFKNIGKDEKDPNVKRQLRESVQQAHNLNQEQAYSDYKKRAETERQQLKKHNAFYDSYHKKNKKKIRRKISSKTTQTIKKNNGSKPTAKPTSKKTPKTTTKPKKKK